MRKARFGIAVARRGWIPAAFFLAAVAAGAVTIAMLALRRFQLNNAPAAASVFLGIGAVAAVYLARPDEHPMATRVLAAARGCLVLTVLASLMAVAVLVFAPAAPSVVREACAVTPPKKACFVRLETPPDWTRVVPISLAGVATFGLLATWLLPGLLARRQKQTLDEAHALSAQ